MVLSGLIGPVVFTLDFEGFSTLKIVCSCLVDLLVLLADFWAIIFAEILLKIVNNLPVNCC